MNAGTKLKVVGRAGAGIDNIDVDAATRSGIIVMNTPGGNSVSTAEHSFGMIMALARNIPQGCATLKNGLWERSKLTGVELRGKTLGIIGFGRLGNFMAKYAKAFGMKVFYYDPFKNSKNCKKTNLKRLFKISDVISIHAHVNDKTKHMINKKIIRLARKKPIIINTSRGELVNEKDIIWGLKNKKISGYGADVIEKEFIDIEKSPIIKNINKYNIIVTPHIGGMTYQGQERAYNYAINKIKK